MITRYESIPRRTKLGLSGQNVLYSQFNDISFFIEDSNQEHLYFVIFKKLFPEIRLSKIFPLGGKVEVIRKAKASLRKKKLVFIVDKDFDDIRQNRVFQPNLFYLKQYSVENYLLEQVAIEAFIVEENPRLKEVEIKQRFALEAFLSDRVTELTELFTLFLVAQNIGYHNCNLPPERFVDAKNKCNVNQSKVVAYRSELEQHFTDRDEFLEMFKEYGARAFKPHNPRKNRRHISGKYLCFMTKNRICSEFHLRSLSNSSFCFRLAKSCHFQKMSFLQKSISRFIAN